MKDEILNIRVSDTGNPLRNMLILVHALVEVILVVKNGVDFRAIDNFDLQFEKDRSLGKHKADDEPGDNPDAPYRSEHRFATWMESALCKFMGLSGEAHKKRPAAGPPAI
jgi:hypothetical protein